MANAKIMIVERNPLVAEDIEERLQTLGYTVCAVVSSRVEAVAKAVERRPDLALINPELEGKTEGVEAAKEIYERCDIPVIYLTDYANEDLLEKVKSTRAFGHVYKPYETNQLYLSIENHLHWFQEDQELRDREQRVSTILNSIGDAVISTDEGGFVTFMNPVAEILTGCPLEEACGKYITNVFNVSVGESNRSIRTSLMNVLHRGITLHWGLSAAGDDAYLNAKSGLKIAIDYSAAPLKDKKGNIVGMAVTFRDMRKHKEVENRLEETINELQNQTQLMETVFNSISDGITVINPMGETLLANPSAERIFGMPPQGVPPEEWAETYGIFYPDQETYIPADQMPVTQALHGQILEEGEFFIRNKEQPDGIHAKGRAVPLFDSNREIRGSVAIIRDITQDKIAAAQLEQTITELQNQVQLTDTIFNSISDGVVVTDQEGNFLLVNPSAERIVGMGATETIPDEWAETYGTFYPDKVTPFPSDQLPLVHAMQGKITDAVDVFIRNQENPDGSFISVYGRPLRDQQSEVRGGVIVFRDVTKIKHAEARLEQTIDEMEKQAQLMDTIFDNMSDGVVVADDKGQYIMANPAAEKMIGQDFEDLNLPQASEQYGLFEPTTDALFPADQLPLALAIKGETTNNVEMRVNSEQLSQEVYVSINGRPLLDKQGTLRGGVVVARDITQLKQIEHRLEETITKLENQNQLMDTVFNSISDGVVVTDEKGNFLLVNPEAEQIIGMGATETPPDKWSEKYGIFYPDKTTPFPAEQPLMRAISGEPIDGLDLFIRNSERPQGVYVNVSGRALKSSTGDVRGSVIALRDVTALKETEVRLEETITELQDQNQLMDTVFNSISDGVTVTDEKGNFLLVNPEAEQIFGMGAMEVTPDQWAETYGIFQLDKTTPFSAEQPLMRVISGEAIDDINVFVRNSERPQGVYVNVSGRPLQSSTGDVRGCVIAFRDITQLKETEVRLEQTITELQDQNQLMDTVFNSISDGLTVIDDQGQFLFVNSEAERIVGMGPTDTSPSEWAETYGIFYPDKVTPFPVEQSFLETLSGQGADEAALFVRNPEKPEGVYIHVRGRPLQSNEGNIKGAVILTQDITKLRETEVRLEETITELQDQNQLMDTVFNSISDGLTVIDDQGQFLFFNSEAERIGGMGATETSPSEWAETYGIFYPDQVTPFPVEQAFMDTLSGKGTGDVTLFIRNSERPEGVYIHARGRPLQSNEGDMKGAVMLTQDITKLRETEHRLEQTITELQNQTQLMEAVFNHMSDGVILADEEGQYIMANRTAEQMTGRSLQQPVGVRNAVERYGFFLPDEKTPFPADQLPIARALRDEPADNIGMFIYDPSVMREGIHLSVSARPLYDAQGAITGSVSVSRDVTELRQAEANLKHMISQLEEQGTLLESIFNSISDGVVVADANGNFTIFNPSAERIVGIGATETDTDEWSDTYGLFFPDRVTPFPPDELPLVRAIQGETADEVEMFVRNPNVPDGVFISVNGRPLQDDEGNPKGGVIVFRDVTQRMIAEEALTQAFAQGRLEIVDTILHNIGNAINSVTSGAEMLHRELHGNPLIRRLAALASAIKAREDDWIDYIKNDPQGQQVLPFVCAIADDFNNQNSRWLERTERIKLRATHIADIVITQKSFGNSSIVRKDVSIYKMIDDALKLQQEMIDKRGIQIDIDCENAPQEIRIQESQFHQMLVNLIKNSIEAIDELVQSDGLNETPRIRIRTYIDGDFYCLEVIDNGIGIKPENSKTIFAAGYTTKKSGSGLGLHSSANFVIASGGQIQPLSEGIGKGMTMRVMLRLSSILP